MRLSIVHETTYRFSKAVFLEPHFLRFKPKNTSGIQLESFQLELSPNAAGMADRQDAEGNHFGQYWFSAPYSTLHIKAQSVVSISPFNPFNFLIYPDGFAQHPFDYPGLIKTALAQAMVAEDLSPGLIGYGKAVLEDNDHQAVPFLVALTALIFQDFEVIYREEGQPHHPDETFQLKKGSCRDLAWMQIHLLRQLGFAARFVSGYHYVAVEQPDYELHAWLQVFLPGAGWIGLDPSSGILTGNTHVTVAESIHFEHTMPITGTFRGDAQSTLETSLLIEELI